MRRLETKRQKPAPTSPRRAGTGSDKVRCSMELKRYSKLAKTRQKIAQTCRNITKTPGNERFFRIFCHFLAGGNRFDWRRASDEWG